MKLTPEQEFLKALALSIIEDDLCISLSAAEEYLKSLKHEQRMNASCLDCNDSGMYKGYDISCRCGSKVKPEWTPEVGKLYQRKKDKVIIEVDEIVNVSTCYRIIGGVLDGIREACYSKSFSNDHIPIAELKGLKEGDEVWIYSPHHKRAMAYTIFRIVLDCIWVSYGDNRLALCFDGTGYYQSGITACRTKERAERFGEVQE